jgi:RNase P protein component
MVIAAKGDGAVRRNVARTLMQLAFHSRKAPAFLAGEQFVIVAARPKALRIGRLLRLQLIVTLW